MFAHSAVCTGKNNLFYLFVDDKCVHMNFIVKQYIRNNIQIL